MLYVVPDPPPHSARVVIIPAAIRVRSDTSSRSQSGPFYTIGKWNIGVVEVR